MTYRSIPGSLGLLGLSLPLLWGLLLISCTKRNPNYCDGQLCDDLQEGADAARSDTDGATEPDASNTSPTVDASIAPECPSETHACVPAVPEGWAGPTVHAEYDVEDLPVLCPSSFSASANVYNWGIESDGSCDCSCGVARSLTCTDAYTAMGKLGSSSCLGRCLDITEPCPRPVDLAPNSCTNMLHQPNWGGYENYPRISVRVGMTESSTCDRGRTTNQLEAARFTQRSTVCTAEPNEVAGACGNEATCAPKAPDEFAGQMCIVKEGKHECPADSPYSEHKALFSSLEDNRSCPSGCSCEVEAGSNCGKVVFGENSCVNSSANESRGSCMERDFVPRYAKYIVDPAEHQCSPAGPVPVQGAAVGVGEVTLCCMPEADDS